MLSTAGDARNGWITHGPHSTVRVLREQLAELKFSRLTAAAIKAAGAAWDGATPTATPTVSF
jgi:hypothetical protein